MHPREVRPGAREWPPLLSENVQPPVERLWALGRDPSSLGECVAIVGARNCTPYGIAFARGLAADLAAEGLCIVSGLARGIDASAHEGALWAGGTTIAVLAGGVDVPYPALSQGLYRRVIARGAVISERAPGAKPYKQHFLERNRIIAGIARAVVMVQGEFVELGKKSGALITANKAAEFGRDVLAVPGDVNAVVSEGPHQLLREGAAICTRASDVLEKVRGSTSTRTPRLREIPEDFPAPERAVLEAVTTAPARSNAVATRSDMPIADVNRLLTRLELRGWIARDVAGYYRRLR